MNQGQKQEALTNWVKNQHQTLFQREKTVFTLFPNRRNSKKKVNRTKMEATPVAHHGVEDNQFSVISCSLEHIEEEENGFEEPAEDDQVSVISCSLGHIEEEENGFEEPAEAETNSEQEGSREDTNLDTTEHGASPPRKVPDFQARSLLSKRHTVLNLAVPQLKTPVQKPVSGQADSGESVVKIHDIDDMSSSVYKEILSRTCSFPNVKILCLPTVCEMEDSLPAISRAPSTARLSQISCEVSCVYIQR